MTTLPATAAANGGLDAVFDKMKAHNLPFEEDAFAPVFGGLGLPLLKKAGNQWTVTVGSDRTPTKLGGKMNRLQCVFAHGNPTPGRVYYAAKYQPGVIVPPTCWSADGIAPAPSASAPQSATCARCPHSVLNGRAYACGKEYNFLVFIVDPKFVGFARFRMGGGDYTRGVVDVDLKEERFMSPSEFNKAMHSARQPLMAAQVELAFDSGDSAAGGHPTKPVVRIVDATPADILETISEMSPDDRKHAVRVHYAVPKQEAEAAPEQERPKSTRRAAPAAITLEAEAQEVEDAPAPAPRANPPLRPAAPKAAAAAAPPRPLAAAAQPTGNSKLDAIRARLAQAKAAPAHHEEGSDDV